MLAFTVIGEADLDAIDASVARTEHARATPCTNPRPDHPGRHWSKGHDIPRQVCTGCTLRLA